MAVVAFPYPVTLTNKDWQKKKGLLNRSTKTGIGECLTALEKAFASTPYGKLDPDQLAGDTLDPVLFGKKLDAMSASFRTVEAKLRPLITAADQRINQALPTFTGPTAGDARKHLDLMKRELQKFQSDLTGYPKLVSISVRKGYKARLTKSSSYIQLQSGAGSADAKMKELFAKIKKVEAAGTIASIGKEFGGDGAHRSLTTWCKLWDQLVLTPMPEFAKQFYPQKAMATVFTLPWLKELGNETRGDATKAVQALAKNMDERKAVTKFTLEYSRSAIEAQTFVKSLIKAAKALEDAAKTI